MGGKLKVEHIKIKGIFVSTCNTDAGFFPNPKSQNSWSILLQIIQH